jgi:hypothetical protein
MGIPFKRIVGKGTAVGRGTVIITPRIQGRANRREDLVENLKSHHLFPWVIKIGAHNALIAAAPKPDTGPIPKALNQVLSFLAEEIIHMRVRTIHGVGGEKILPY